MRLTKSAEDDKKEQIELLFRSYFAELCGFSSKYVGDLEVAKDIVHDTFLALWDKFDSLPADTHFKSYLFTATRNRCLNSIRDRKNHEAIDTAELLVADEEYTGIETIELAQKIEQSLSLLPEKCHEIFILSRVEGMKYAAIAEHLNISVKTVEAQMSKALRLLRSELAEYLSIILIFLLK